MESLEKYNCSTCGSIVPFCNRNIHEARCQRALERNRILDHRQVVEKPGNNSTQRRATGNRTMPRFDIHSSNSQNFGDIQSSELSEMVSNVTDSSSSPSSPSHFNSQANVTTNRNRSPLDTRNHFAKSSLQTPWACEVCTFENKEIARECEMCGNPPPRSTPPSAPFPEPYNIHPPAYPATHSHQDRAQRQRNIADPMNCQRTGSQQWTCAHCTCTNNLRSAQCVACDNPRPPDSTYHDTLLGERMDAINEDPLHFFDDAFYPPRYGTERTERSSVPSHSRRPSNPLPTPPPPVNPVLTGAALGALGGAGLAMMSGRNISGGLLAGVGLGGIVGSMYASQNTDTDTNTDHDAQTYPHPAQDQPRRGVQGRYRSSSIPRRIPRTHSWTRAIQSQSQTQSQTQSQMPSQNGPYNSPFDSEHGGAFGSQRNRTRVFGPHFVGPGSGFVGPDSEFAMQQMFSNSMMGPMDMGPIIMGPDNMDHQIRAQMLRHMHQFQQMDMMMNSHAQFGVTAGGPGPGLDLSYEGLLARFPPTSSQRPAPSSTIASLPTHTHTRKCTGETDNTKQTMKPLSTAVGEDKKGEMEEEEEEKCGICLDFFGAGQCMKTLPCWHVFHADCVDEWLAISGTCPVCKTVLS